MQLLQSILLILLHYSKRDLASSEAEQRLRKRKKARVFLPPVVPLCLFFGFSCEPFFLLHTLNISKSLQAHAQKGAPFLSLARSPALFLSTALLAAREREESRKACARKRDNVSSFFSVVVCRFSPARKRATKKPPRAALKTPSLSVALFLPFSLFFFECSTPCFAFGFGCLVQKERKTGKRSVCFFFSPSLSISSIQIVSSFFLLPSSAPQPRVALRSRCRGRRRRRRRQRRRR